MSTTMVGVTTMDTPVWFVLLKVNSIKLNSDGSTGSIAKFTGTLLNAAVIQLETASILLA